MERVAEFAGSGIQKVAEETFRGVRGEWSGGNFTQKYSIDLRVI